MSTTRLDRHRLLRDAVERLQVITEEAVELLNEITVRTRYDGLSIREGIWMCLGDNGAPISVEDIASELWLGGAHTRGDNFEKVLANVRTTLRTMRQEGEVRLVPLQGYQLK